MFSVKRAVPVWEKAKTGQVPTWFNVIHLHLTYQPMAHGSQPLYPQHVLVLS